MVSCWCSWVGVDLPAVGLGKGGVQLGPLMCRCLPSRCAMEALAEETIHEARHRQATTFGLMKQSGDDGTRDDRLVAGSVCHQESMPQERGLLQRNCKSPSHLRTGACE